MYKTFLMLKDLDFNKTSISKQFELKVSEFSKAIEKYNTSSFYITFETVLAVSIVILQLLSLINLIQTFQYPGGTILIVSLLISYIATDFINGLVHMIVDNNTNYTSIVGPFIAAFHLHHLKVKYTPKHPLTIYFTESGHKFWLVFYLIALTLLQHNSLLSTGLNLGLVNIGILSSVAELSHYWCHNPPKKNALILFLQRHRILLSFKHHRLHHLKDNTNYAFLNGFSDPLLNIIARLFYKGYKNNSDKHVATYIKQTLNI